MRWRQCRETGKLIPIDTAAQQRGGMAYVRDYFEPFKSPIDGSIIKNQRDLANHNKRHSVTNTADFGPDWVEKKARERKEALTQRTKEEAMTIKRHMYEQIIRAENGLQLRELS